MRMWIFLMAGALSGCIGVYEVDALQRENERLREELEQVKALEPERTETPDPDPPGWQIYEVKNRDALSDIATRFYGDSTGWEEIYAANRDVIGDDPDRLTIGMKLRIPPRD